MKKLGVTLMLLISCIFLLCSPAASSSATQLREATFTVGWFDVGKAALDGQKGVVTVEKGWQNMREVNRVVYDPKKIHLQELEDSLKKSGTYIDTIAPKTMSNDWQTKKRGGSEEPSHVEDRYLETDCISICQSASAVGDGLHPS